MIKKGNIKFPINKYSSIELKNIDYLIFPEFNIDISEK